MIKIAIFGIGGVGGYIGGMLAKQYENSIDVEIYFIARGENEQRIRRDGLKLETTKGNFTARPKIITSDYSNLGSVDLLICCIKSYDIQKSMDQLMPCIGSHTIILPLLNGVDWVENIKKMFPGNRLWGGCIYLVSKLVEPGFVKETGNLDQLYFGALCKEQGKLAEVEHLFRDAKISAEVSSDIMGVMWEKFVFISAFATITSFYDSNIGTILSEPLKRNQLFGLFEEIIAVANANGISLPHDIIQKAFEKISLLPYESTSSMHLDFKKNKTTELDSLTGYIINLGNNLGIRTPLYEKMYRALKIKSAGRSI